MFDEGIDDIPSADDPLDELLCCDVCMRKDDTRTLAQIYCVICKKKFCIPHEKVYRFESNILLTKLSSSCFFIG